MNKSKIIKIFSSLNSNFYSYSFIYKKIQYIKIETLNHHYLNLLPSNLPCVIIIMNQDSFFNQVFLSYHFHIFFLHQSTCLITYLGLHVLFSFNLVAHLTCICLNQILTLIQLEFAL